MSEFVVPSPGGRIEARFHAAPYAGAPSALILHQHPRIGGSMQDPLTITLFNMFVKRGFSVMRFNFSTSGMDGPLQDMGMLALSDAAFMLDHLHTINRSPRFCWVAGFSFGAWVCLQLLMRRPEIDGFIAVAPPANHYDLTFLAPCPASGLILAGGADVVAPEDSIRNGLSKVQRQKGENISIQNIAGANHFFHGKLGAVETTAGEYLDTRLKTRGLSRKTDTKLRLAEDAVRAQ